MVTQQVNLFKILEMLAVFPDHSGSLLLGPGTALHLPCTLPIQLLNHSSWLDCSRTVSSRI